MLLTDLHEAKVSSGKAGTAMTKIISYLEKHLGIKLQKLSVENFKNSKGSGVGVRYVEVGTVNCLRFNWVGSKSSEIVSIDIWNGTSRDPQFNISTEGVSFAKALPDLVRVLKKPKVGKVKVVGEVSLTEAKKGEYDAESSVKDMIKKLEAGRSFNRSEFVMHYHPENAHAYDEFVEAHSGQLVINGKRISLPKGEKLTVRPSSNERGEPVAPGSGELVVAKGGTGEQYEVDVPDVDRVTYSDSLAHLEGLTQGLIRGSFNALFVAGKGGTGKTQTVEQVLHDNGLVDGNGYFKVTNSASPRGLYEVLYKYRDDVILFDDCDGALDSQDGRNIIKSATDTKKVRKLAWAKKGSGMYDPDSPSELAKADAKANRAEAAEGEDELDDEVDERVPRYFNYTGQIIFISNLPLAKLDPDGALRTRAFIIAIDPTPDEIIERMGQILNSIQLENGLELSSKERQKVLDVIKAGRRKSEASLRTLVRALNLAASGAPNWEELVRRYA